MTKTYIAAITYMLATTASLAAEISPVAAIGHAKINPDMASGHQTWTQTGWDQQTKHDGPVYSLGARLEPERFPALEFLYHDLGNMSIGALVGQADDKNWKADGDHCVGPCGPTKFYYTYNRVKGISASALPEFKVGPADLYLRLGVMRYRADGASYFTEDNTQSRKFTTYTIEHAYGWSPVIGAGAAIKQWTIEFTMFTNIKPRNGGVESVEALMFGRRF